MACDKFETEGLLYCSGELAPESVTEYESHLEQCPECSTELKQFRELFGNYSVAELLCEEPSAACDAKIIKALEAEAVRQSRPIVTFPGIFTLLIQRVAIPVAIFLVAVTVGLQISSKTGSKSIPLANSSDTSSIKKDSMSDTGRIFIQGGANGVIPVTLEEK